MTNNMIRKIRLTPSALLILCCFLAGIKLMLISGEEIIAANRPHDDLWQILAAARWYWFGDYTYMTFVHLPVYPLWIATTHFAGLPLRIGIEILFVASAVVFSLSLSKAGVHKGICLAACCLIIFHPVSFHVFNYALADTLYPPVLLLALAALIMMWIYREDRRCMRYSVAMGIFFSILWNLRKENILIVGLLLFMALVFLLALWREDKSWQAIGSRIAVLILIPGAIILIVSFSLRAMNFMKFGLFVSTEMAAPGYCAAYKALQRIRPPQSIRFVPVSKAAREAGYGVSPAFRELEPYLEGQLGYNWAALSQELMGPPGEIGAGFFYWALRDAVAMAGHYRSAREADVYFQRIADEINGAIDDGRLPGRTVVISFLDPDASNYLPYLPDSLLTMWRLFTPVTEPVREKEDPNLPINIRKAFDIMANRRPALTSGGPVTLNGWAFHESEGITQISLRTAEGRVLASTVQFSPRPDVTKGYKANGMENVPENTGFTLTIAQGRQLLDAYLVMVTDRNGEYAIPYNQIDAGKTLWAALPGADKKVNFALDSVSQPKNSGEVQKSLQSFLWTIYGKIVAYLTYIGIFGVVVLLFCYKNIDVKDNIYVILSILLFVVLSRVSFFALLDASSWPGNAPRYLLPVMPVYSCFLLVFIYKTFCVVKDTMNPPIAIMQN
jgi:hypothetical protein